MDEFADVTEEQIIGALEPYGSFWCDYILMGSPPLICRYIAEEGPSALLIEDERLAKAAVAFLLLRGAQRFADIDELKAVLGWSGSFTVKPRSELDGR
jgi:hypothetical protein